jgi:hypothetical protein
MRAWAERTTPLDVVLSPERQLDPCDPSERQELAELVGAYAAIGATVLSLRFRHRSLAHYLEQLDAVAAEIVPAFVADD